MRFSGRGTGANPKVRAATPAAGRLTLACRGVLVESAAHRVLGMDVCALRCAAVPASRHALAACARPSHGGHSPREGRSHVPSARCSRRAPDSRTALEGCGGARAPGQPRHRVRTRGKGANPKVRAATPAAGRLTLDRSEPPRPYPEPRAPPRGGFTTTTDRHRGGAHPDRKLSSIRNG